MYIWGGVKYGAEDWARLTQGPVTILHMGPGPNFNASTWSLELTQSSALQEAHFILNAWCRLYHTPQVRNTPHPLSTVPTSPIFE